MTNPLARWLPYADKETPKPEEGTWVLVSPSGLWWKADSPMRCVQAEMNARVPPSVALGRIARSLQEMPDEEPGGPDVQD